MVAKKKENPPHHELCNHTYTERQEHRSGSIVIDKYTVYMLVVANMANRIVAFAICSAQI